MGYTHYWEQTRDLDPEEWKVFTDGVENLVTLVNRDGPVLVYEYDEPEKPPVVNKDMVRFNGNGDDGHETFLVTRVASPWAFCKTARKPYDSAVVACLCCLHSIGGHDVSSDGDWEDWIEGCDLAKKVWPDIVTGIPTSVVAGTEE